MNRRVLLIDSDPAFRDTLTRELARYKVVVMTEPNVERALALAGADAPALILLCIEEADKKAGFRVFEKCKKGALSKVPIILVTGSVPADSFAKHRSLKVHADEYIDKRTMSTHELVGKIDGLIALGDPEDEDLAIPIEDEIPMEIAEGDVVLDEVVGDDLDEPTEHPAMLGEPEAHNEFDQNDAATVGPSDGLTMDAVVEAETDAAFDALMGGFGDEPAPEATAVAEQGEHREPSITMPPAEPELSPVDAVVDATLGVVPEPIIDGRGRGTTPPPLLAESIPGMIIDQPPMRDDHHGRTQLPGLGPIADAIPEPVPHQEPALPPAPVVPEPIHDEPMVADAMSGAIDVGVLADLAEPEMPAETAVMQHETLASTEDEQPRQATDVYSMHEDVAEDDDARMDSQPAIMIDDDELVPLDDEVPVEVDDSEPAVVSSPVPQMDHTPLPPVLPPDADLRQPMRAGSGSHPAIDLGLDVVAQDAQSEQSGVYDRRALRKIGELERQIAQLKVELERARSAGEAAAKGGRESQFLHLRESMLAKDKELKQLKTDLASRESELAETGEKMRQALSRLTTLEGKQAELENRATEETARAQKLAATGKSTESQVAGLQAELAAAQQAAQRAETARQQLEKDLATERATGKASASESERLLRTEREQIAQRHQAELAAARNEGEAAKQAAVTRLREELEAAHGTALEQRTEELRRTHAAERDAAAAALETQHAGAIVALKSDHAGEHSRVKSELGGQLSQLEGELAAAKAAHEAALEQHEQAHATALEQQAQTHASELAKQAQTHASDLAKQKTEHAVTLEEQGRAHASKLASAIAEKDKAHAQAIAAAATDRDSLIAAAAAEADKAREELEAAHAEVFAAQDRTHADALTEQRRIFAASLADKDATATELARRNAEVIGARDLALDDLRIELRQARTAHESKLDAAKKELDSTVAAHEQTRGELVEQHRAALAELTGTHEEELAKLAADRDQVADAARRAADSHRSAVAELTTKHTAELSQVAESAGREVAEHKAAAGAARRANEEAVARHTAERADADKAHAQAIADVEAKVERQLAIANGEFLKQKSVADAEHVRALAAATTQAETARAELVTEHARVLKEITAERDELRRGLSTARDSLKRSESELASAVQSIADRNADIRQHVGAIAERDQRLADLRKEIEALEAENTSYQDQVLRAYQKIKTDEASVARARKAMAIALTVLDDQGNPKET